jgi:hypothetical protein
MFRNRSRVYGAWLKVKGFCTNVWRYRAWLVMDRDFDWAYLGHVIQMKLRFMADHFDTHKFYEGFEQDVVDLREAADVLERLMSHPDEYYDNPQAHVNDRARFGELMSKIENWWD